VQGSGGSLAQGGMQGGGSLAQGGMQTTGGVNSTGGLSGSGVTRATGGTKSAGGAVGSGGTQPSAGSQGVIRARKIETRGFTFDALEAGSSGEPVLLLHGFPDTSLEWTALMPVLAANGYHCLAPDQRGYSPGARPTEVDAYNYQELVADAFAFGDELGQRFHVVAHDWGANIAWLMLQKAPSRIASFTSIAVPHYQVWARAVYNDPDLAGYLSMLNTWMAPGKGEAFWTASAMKNMWTAKPADQREATIAHMTEPGAMTAALNWYRASDGHKKVIDDFDAWKVSVPTLLIFGSDDIGQNTVAATTPFMTGPYRVVQPKGDHFVVDEQPKPVADETLAQLRAYPIK
jgi:pimeloyl-ACP methyl ester carboxylesterase